MAGSVNKVILLGNLGKDPDIRATSTGSRLASFSIATSTKYRNKDSQQLEDKTEWHRIVVFNDKLADICEKYIYVKVQKSILKVNFKLANGPTIMELISTQQRL